MKWAQSLEFSDVLTLSKDLSEAMKMMGAIDKIVADLPGLDCGACGSPSCRAFAEDVVRGFCKKSDCVFVLRAKMKEVASTISKLDDDLEKGL